MRCPNCGFDNPDSVKFCGECGAKLERKCPGCGTLNPARFKFCGVCGAALGPAGVPSAPPSSAPAQPTVPSPLPATVPRVAVPGESERRVCTVLFADVSGSTAIGEKLDPEEYTNVMNQAFQLLSAKIVKYEGTIDKYIGDAVMALFGAPVAHENDPERAIRAALEMQDALDEYTERLMKTIGLPLRMRIGINTGEVIAGGVGSDARADYTVMGDTVNVASRLEHAAPVGGVLVADETYSQTKGMFDWEFLEPITVKGKSEPVQVYRPLRVARQRRGVRGLEGRMAPMVGRSTEIVELEAAFERVLAGQPSVVAVAGEAGIGKSRLRHEFREALAHGGHLEHVTHLQGRSLPYTQADTYGAILGILRDFFDVRDTDTDEIIRQKLALRPPGWDITWPLLPILAGVPPTTLFPYLSPEQWRRQAATALLGMVEHAARERTVILFFEDVHWIDPSSLEMLTYLVERVRNLPVLFFLVYRPDFDEPALIRKHPSFRRLDLHPLTPEDCALLIENLLVQTELPPQIKDLIVQRSGGNPFYVEEIIKSFVESQVLVQRDGIWRATRDVQALQVPDNVQAVIMARIDMLDDRTKRMLQQAAVIGRRFPLHLLEAISDVPGVSAALDRLEELAFCFPTGSADEYVFKHVLSQEVAYNSLLIRRRKELHRKSGEAMERLYRSRVDQHLDAVASHFFRGDHWPKALEYSTRAGDRAKALWANAEALRYYDQVLAVLDHLVAGPGASVGLVPAASLIGVDLNEVRIVTHVKRGDVYAITADYDAALASYERGLQDAQRPEQRADIQWRIGDSVHEKRSKYDLALGCFASAAAELGGARGNSAEMARVRTSISRVYFRQGKFEPARQFAQQCTEQLRGTQYHAEQARALRQLGNICYATSEWQQAIEYWRQGLEIAERTGDPREAAPIYNNLGIVYYRLGDYPAATKSFEDSLRMVEKIGDTTGIAAAFTHLGACYRAYGDLQAAIDQYEKSLVLKRRIGDRRGELLNLLNLGEAHRELAEVARSVEELGQSLRIAEEIGASESLGEIHRQLGESYLELGELDRALASAERALQYDRETNEKLEEAMALRVIGKVRQACDQLDEAEQHLRTAITILAELKAEHEEARVCCDLAQLLLARGKLTDARSVVNRVTDIFERVGSPQERAQVMALRDRLEQVPSSPAAVPDLGPRGEG
ncbi:MAG: tetratricopeptide repeat protein [Chloroflexi bacterium]|nr:tetratricopeptide repeat protein [Chloroflexota bacterium]